MIELLMLIFGFGIPTVGIVMCVRAKEKRLEATDENALKTKYALRRLEIEHEQRVLRLAGAARWRRPMKADVTRIARRELPFVTARTGNGMERAGSDAGRSAGLPVVTEVFLADDAKCQLTTLATTVSL